MNFLQVLPKAKYAGRVLQLSDYTASLAPTPSKVYLEYKVPLQLWEMLGNDSVGDCEIARIAHMLMLFTAHTGKMVTPTLAEVMAAYSAISGYDPLQTQPDGSNPTDVGCNTEDVLEYWRTTGIAGHKILAWVKTAPTQEAIKQAIYLFGGAALDIAVYQWMMDQFSGHQPWDTPALAARPWWKKIIEPVSAAPLLGYHAVPFFGFGSDGITGVTWGALQSMGWPTALSIMQNNYAVITQDWIDAATEKTPSGFDLAQLQADLAALKVV